MGQRKDQVREIVRYALTYLDSENVVHRNHAMYLVAIAIHKARKQISLHQQRAILRDELLRQGKTKATAQRILRTLWPEISLYVDVISFSHNAPSLGTIVLNIERGYRAANPVITALDEAIARGEVEFVEHPVYGFAWVPKEKV